MAIESVTTIEFRPNSFSIEEFQAMTHPRAGESTEAYLKRKGGPWPLLHRQIIHNGAAGGNYLCDIVDLRDPDGGRAAWVNGRDLVMGSTGLHMACITGDVDLVQRLLNFGADANLVTRNGWTALHIAAARADMAMIRVLMPHTRAGATTVLGATWQDHLKMVSDERDAAEKSILLIQDHSETKVSARDLAKVLGCEELRLHSNRVSPKVMMSLFAGDNHAETDVLALKKEKEEYLASLGVSSRLAIVEGPCGYDLVVKQPVASGAVVTPYLAQYGDGDALVDRAAKVEEGAAESASGTAGSSDLGLLQSDHVRGMGSLANLAFPNAYFSELTCVGGLPSGYSIVAAQKLRKNEKIYLSYGWGYELLFLAEYRNLNDAALAAFLKKNSIYQLLGIIEASMSIKNTIKGRHLLLANMSRLTYILSVLPATVPYLCSGLIDINQCLEAMEHPLVLSSCKQDFERKGYDKVLAVMRQIKELFDALEGKSSEVVTKEALANAAKKGAFPAIVQFLKGELTKDGSYEGSRVASGAGGR